MPQLSTHPTYYFVDKATGNRSERNINGIVRDWEVWRTEEKERRRQERKVEKRNQQLGGQHG